QGFGGDQVADDGCGDHAASLVVPVVGALDEVGERVQLRGGQRGCSHVPLTAFKMVGNCSVSPSSATATSHAACNSASSLDIRYRGSMITMSRPWLQTS